MSTNWRDEVRANWGGDVCPHPGVPNNLYTSISGIERQIDAILDPVGLVFWLKVENGVISMISSVVERPRNLKYWAQRMTNNLNTNFGSTDEN